jgi:uncharacterized membrane protein YkgB
MMTQQMLGTRIEAWGKTLTRYGLVVVFVWIGAMKFTAYEAGGIQPLAANSPLMSWMYSFLSVQGFSNFLGVVEIATGLFIALRPVSPKLAALGGAMGTATFLTTLTFLLSTPGWEPTMGFPALSAMPGQFLIKDAVLLGASVWVLGEALTSMRTGAVVSVS